MIQLMLHQQQAVDVARDHSRFGFLWDCGTGKTIAMLAAISDARSRGFAGKTLVLCPKSIMRAAWLADASHFPHLKVVVCWHATAQQRSKLIATPGADVLVLNPACFKKHADELIAAGVTRLIIDESSMCKNPQADITKAATDFADQMQSVYILSGTPAPNSDVEYLPQMRIVDRGVFSPVYWHAVNRYFVAIKKQIGWKIKPSAYHILTRLTVKPRNPNLMHYPEASRVMHELGLQRHLMDQVFDPAEAVERYEPRDDTRGEFLTKLRSRSWALRKDECLDLPPQTDVVREVELSADERRAYKSMLDELRIDLGDGETLSAAINAKLIKLRQITGGVVYGAAEAGGKRVTALGESKLNELRATLEEIGREKVVIWAEFTAEIDRIASLLDDWKVTRPGIIDGRASLDVRQECIEKFQKGDLQYLVCQPQAAGHGITLHSASYNVFSSLSFSYETHEQARNRIHRAGQSRPVTNIYLIAKDTVDEAIFGALRQKKSASEAVLKYLGAGKVSREEMAMAAAGGAN